MIDGAYSEDVRICFAFPQGRVQGPLLFLLHMSDLLMILEYALDSYNNDSPMLAEVSKPSESIFHFFYLIKMILQCR